MDFLGVGPMELIFILIIALIVLGPKDMIKAGKSIGIFLRRIVTSPTWNAVQQTSRDLRYLPNRLMREAGLEEQAEELKKIGQEVQDLNKTPSTISQDVSSATREINRDLSAWTTAPTIASPPPPTLDPTSAPTSNHSEEPLDSGEPPVEHPENPPQP
jgi:Sec-independent protein translocase protein TatA